MKRIVPPAAACVLAALLAGCGSAPVVIEREEATGAPPPAAGPAKQAARPGAYYKDDGPGEDPPDLDAIPDAEPRIEPLHRFANNPYTVFGVTYTPLRSHVPFRQRGIASWYGRMFHGQRTSSGEIYDMYAMTGAHPTLPIPSYARVTHVGNGRSVIVRINDRGPFHPGRIIDLSYAAAHRLGYAREGSAPVEVELLTPETIMATKAGSSAPMRVADASASTPPREPAVTAAGTVSVASPPAAAPDAGTAVYVQAGAFVSRANAESLRARILREVAGIAGAAVEILHHDGAFRVHVGPYRSRDEAAGLVQRLRDLLRIDPLFVSR